MKLKLLNEIADVRKGFALRGKLEHTPGADTAVIQPKDIARTEKLDQYRFTRIPLPQACAPDLLEPGDLILQAQGGSNTTFYIDLPMIRTVCAAPLVVIRIRSYRVILPAYLEWYINLMVTQEKIAATACGRKVKTVPVNMLEALAVPVPTLKIQREIVIKARGNYANEMLEANQAWERKLRLEAGLLNYATRIDNGKRKPR